MNDPRQQPYLVTIGECLGVLASNVPGPLSVGSTLRLGFAGAESNVAIGISRLGGAAVWIGRVSEDELGEMILRELRAEGVGTVAVRDPAPTSMLFKERRTAAHTRVSYNRSIGAGTRLTPQDVPEETVAGAAILHVTGITPALGAGPAAAVLRALDIAEEAGVPVSLDINYRSQLWDQDEAARTLLPILGRADLVFASPNEAHLAVPGTDPLLLAKGLCALGPSSAVIKLGGEGSVALIDGREYRQPAVAIEVVDTVGAGDAFVAGYLFELITGGTASQRLRTASALGAFAVSVASDWEGLPYPADLSLLDQTDDVIR